MAKSSKNNCVCFTGYQNQSLHRELQLSLTAFKLCFFLIFETLLLLSESWGYKYMSPIQVSRDIVKDDLEGPELPANMNRSK